MLWRALFAFLALPGMVAIVVPALFAMRRMEAGGAFHALGLLPLGVGFGLLLWCVRDSYVARRGALSPWAPPRNLVTRGVYRFSRNPMYVAVALMLGGWALGF